MDVLGGLMVLGVLGVLKILGVPREFPTVFGALVALQMLALNA